MPKKIIKDISASTFQVVFNQILGLGIFFILSRQLSKPDFGDLNFVIAILTVFWGIAGFGIELIAAKRIASGEDPGPIAGIHLIHSVFGSVFFILALSVVLI